METMTVPLSREVEFTRSTEAIVVPDDPRELVDTKVLEHQEIGRSVLHAAHFIPGEYLG